MQPLTVPGNLDSLGAIAEYVKEAAAVANLDKKAAYNLRLAVDEIATNIITHGYEEAGLSGTIEVRADVNDRTLTIVLEDTALAFDPLAQLPQEQEMLQRAIEDQTMNGRGILLTVESVDKFVYERVGERNQNIFIVNRPLN